MGSSSKNFGPKEYSPKKTLAKKMVQKQWGRGPLNYFGKY